MASMLRAPVWRLFLNDIDARLAVSIGSMKLLRIYQPRNPLFWIMLALNALSYALAWIVQNRSLNTMGMLLIGGFALVNAVLGMWLLWRLAQAAPGSQQLKK